MREKWLIYVLVVLMAVMAAVFGIRYFKRKAPPQTTQASQSVPAPIAKIPEAAKSFCTTQMTELLMNRTYVVTSDTGRHSLRFKRGVFNAHMDGNLVRAGFIGPKKGEITSACGDLSGGDSQVNVVAFDENDGGSTTTIFIVPVFAQDGRLRNGEPFVLGDRVAVEHVTIADHILVIDYTGHGPNTGLCCPDTAKTVHLKLVGNKLVCADKACTTTMQFD